MATWQRYTLQLIDAVNQRILRVFVVDPSSGRSQGYIDGLRAIAVMLVVTLHVWGRAHAQLMIPLPFSSGIDITQIASHGGYGVQLFFILSGFLLAQTFLKAEYRGTSRPSVKQYFMLRVCRIVPAYYVCLFLMLLLFVPHDISPAFVYSKDGIFTLIAHLFFAQFLFPISSNSFMLNGPMWTLTMEMIFYLLLPWVVYGFVRKRWMFALPIAALITFGWFYACHSVLRPYELAVYNYAQQKPLFKWSFDPTAAERYFLWQFPGQAVIFALGITAANLYVWRIHTDNPPSVLRALTGKVAALIYFILGWMIELLSIYPGNPVYALLGSQALAESADSTTTYGYYLTKPLVGVGFALIVVGLALGMDWIRAIFSFTPLRLIGVISYSIYLWHVPLIANFIRFPGIEHLSTAQYFQQLFVQTVLGVMALACFMFLAVEKPFMVLGRRAVRRAREEALANSTTMPLPAVPREPSEAESALITMPAGAGASQPR